MHSDTYALSLVPRLLKSQEEQTYMTCNYPRMHAHVLLVLSTDVAYMQLQRCSQCGPVMHSRQIIPPHLMFPPLQWDITQPCQPCRVIVERELGSCRSVERQQPPISSSLQCTANRERGTIGSVYFRDSPKGMNTQHQNQGDGGGETQGKAIHKRVNPPPQKRYTLARPWCFLNVNWNVLLLFKQFGKR